ncbi:SDR family NAD(P)-dependent oxidoreductase [Kordiimonas gwangyangensis]|uniref:SDR family NAD(P)-dependent oxidoreductase n=1 Tax=Kordiimonas gwangyangensis TaxID=288022 RepID=UPI00035EB854|nr:SDR family NAD(P)-dependent oxidoreductase [Kordiimonas gwangyangensis]
MEPSAENSAAIVIGATGGIGAALCDELEAGGQYARVYRFSRQGGATPLDVCDEASIRAAADKVKAGGMTPKLIIVATGKLHGDGMMPEKSLSALDADAMLESFKVNTIGPALVLKHFLPLLSKRERAVVAILSARVGSIGDNRLGGWYSYRASKAAVNQVVRTASTELARRAKDAICVALHPGTVDTGLTRPFAKSGLEVQAPDLAARRLLDVIAALKPADSGNFFDHKGERIIW